MYGQKNIKLGKKLIRNRSLKTCNYGIKGCIERHIGLLTVTALLRKQTRVTKHYTAEPGYNDTGLCEPPAPRFIESDIVAQINSSLLTIILYSSVRTKLF